MAKPIRIGVIGVGFGARVHIPAYKSEGLDVVAVCSRREKRAIETAERFGIPNAFTDYRSMLKMDGLDAAAVVTPQEFHHAVVMDVLAARKHVICEKPFATTLGDAREMWQAAEAARVTHMIAHEFRFSPARARVKELIDEGYLGPLHSAFITIARGARPGARAHNPSRDDAELGGGLLWSQGSHNVDCLRHWFGEVAWVSGKVFTHLGERTTDAGARVQTTADDAFAMTLGFVDGGWASLTATSAASHGSGVRVEVYGRDGTLVTPQPNVGSPNPPPHAKLLGAKAGDDGLADLPIPERLDPYNDEGHDGLMPTRLLAREFVRGIEQGVSPAPTFYDGYRCQQVLHAVRESSDSGRVIEIPPEVHP
ncbi:MAG: Gfo/Idh/MocA family oxidoreductase [Chloroflexi bacterium]|nr:Gfo/Idh/MocA family oxidoreductase [Chloroflexota bacterium]